MLAEIISVGDELQRGDIVNTNAAYIAKQLRQFDIVTDCQVTVNDQLTAISKAVRLAIGTYPIVIVTGGLGPTADDGTLTAVAKACQTVLQQSVAQWQHIQQIFKHRQIPLTASNQRQAQFIGQPLANHNGLALGSWYETDDSLVIVLPGPPAECETMVIQEVYPRLQAKFGAHESLPSLTLHFLGRPESLLMKELASIIDQTDQLTVTSYVKPKDIQLRIVATQPGLENELHDLSQQIIDREHDYYLGSGEDFDLAQQVVQLLQQHSLRVTAAESLTGGLFQSTICSVPGASNVFDGGFVTYAPAAKESLLGVRKTTVDQFGVVSSQTAEEMAIGCRKKMGVAIGIGFTGVAGPDDLEGHPAGTVWIGLSTPYGTISRELNLAANWGRQRIRELSVQYGLQMIYQLLTK